jgi:hypothetical protein
MPGCEACLVAKGQHPGLDITNIRKLARLDGQGLRISFPDLEVKVWKTLVRMLDS